MVVFYHYASIPLGGSSWPVPQRIFAMGWCGVDLFFVLSGFLIGGILLRAADATNYFSVFYLRRFYRIVPLYYLWVVGYFAFVGLWRSAETWRALPLYLLFVQNSFKIHHAEIGTAALGALWSLAVEEQFYLVIPSLIRFLSRRVVLVSMIAMLFVAPLVRVLLYIYVPAHSAAPYMLTICRADALSLGVLAAFAWRSRRFIAVFVEYRTHAYTLLVALFGGFLALAVFSPLQYSMRMYSWGFSLIDTFFAVAMLMIIFDARSVLAAVCRWRFLGSLGRVSYCVYVIHVLVDYLCHQAIFRRLPSFDSGPTALVSIGAAALSFAIALASWKFFEQPLLQRAHAYRSRTDVLPVRDVAA
jgi:peptidoglycan/LPS O-acetylase OafA/YrhL